MASNRHLTTFKRYCTFWLIIRCFRSALQFKHFDVLIILRTRELYVCVFDNVIGLKKLCCDVKIMLHVYINLTLTL